MKISIVTPSYNQGQFIERTLHSVALQKLNNVELEHVVFDGGSSDNTVDVLKNFTPPVRWISKRDRGQTDAVNQGINATDGEIIGWLNSDDIYYEGALQKVADYFFANPDIDVVYGMADHIDINDKAFESYPTEPWNFDRLKETCFICQPALFFRRRVIDRCGALDETLSFCMDYEYWLRLGLDGIKFAHIEEKLAGSRLYADNKTLGSRVKVHKEINNMFLTKFRNVPERWIINYAHVVVDSKKYKSASRLRLIMLVFYSLKGSLSWNGSLSIGFLKIIKNWF